MPLVLRAKCILVGKSCFVQLRLRKSCSSCLALQVTVRLVKVRSHRALAVMGPSFLKTI